MILKQITPPAAEPIDRYDIEDQCRIGDLTYEERVINRFISAVRLRAESITRRALVTQTWELVLDAFPASGGAITIPLPPLQSVASIKYTDINGAIQALEADQYKVDSDSEPGRIVSAYGLTWPDTRQEIACVRIRFVCGYGPLQGQSHDNVPEAIKQWMTINVANLYENRETETVASGKLTMVDLSTLADGLIDNYRVRGW